MTEYVILVGVVAAAAIAGARTYGVTLGRAFERITETLRREVADAMAAGDPDDRGIIGGPPAPDRPDTGRAPNGAGGGISGGGSSGGGGGLIVEGGDDEDERPRDPAERR